MNEPNENGMCFNTHTEPTLLKLEKCETTSPVSRLYVVAYNSKEKCTLGHFSEGRLHLYSLDSGVVKRLGIKTSWVMGYLSVKNISPSPCD